jgi:hypothetical protein
MWLVPEAGTCSGFHRQKDYNLHDMLQSTDFYKHSAIPAKNTFAPDPVSDPVPGLKERHPERFGLLNWAYSQKVIIYTKHCIFVDVNQ